MSHLLSAASDWQKTVRRICIRAAGDSLGTNPSPCRLVSHIHTLRLGLYVRPPARGPPVFSLIAVPLKPDCVNCDISAVVVATLALPSHYVRIRGRCTLAKLSYGFEQTEKQGIKCNNNKKNPIISSEFCIGTWFSALKLGCRKGERKQSSSND